MTRTTNMMIFLGVFAVVLALSHFYLLTRVSHYLHLTGSQRRCVGLLLGLLALIALVALPVSRMLPRELAAVLAWIAFPWMGFAFLMLLAMLTTDLVWTLFKIIVPQNLQDPARRLLIQRSFGLAALGATGVLGGFSLWNGLRPVIVKPLSVTLSRLPRALDGLRIVQITDLHIGPLINGAWLRQIVDNVNALKPDLIAITGDVVDGSIEELHHHVASLADLVAPLGVYVVTGNHEYYSGVDAWCAHFAGLGLDVLRNERVSIKGASGDSFDLAGIEDWGARHQFPGQGPDLPRALAGRDTDRMLLLLAHQPAAIEEASHYGVDLQLSGHTHGGQLWPFKYLVYLQQPYVEGLHRHRDTATQIYVSPGTGFWGPPMRFGTAAEITHITLRSEA
jgi:predicted MPP superfamily phosphohydrolase